MSRPVSPAIPDYELRIVARARRVTLRVVPGRGLVVSAPPRMSRRKIAAVVAAHGDWARQALADSESGLPHACRGWPPRQLDLAAIGSRVVIGFVPPGHEPVSGSMAGSMAQAGSVLELVVDADDRVAVAKAVAVRLRPIARQHLVARLGVLAERHGLTGYRRCTIRGQRTVWGSYSASGTLSLNYKLLFLSPELVDYVLLHELAHTRHLDHSPRFWDLLVRCQPDARARHERLRHASRRVPPWLERTR